MIKNRTFNPLGGWGGKGAAFLLYIAGGLSTQASLCAEDHLDQDLVVQHVKIDRNDFIFLANEYGRIQAGFTAYNTHLRPVTAQLSFEIDYTDGQYKGVTLCTKPVPFTVPAGEKPYRVDASTVRLVLPPMAGIVFPLKRLTAFRPILEVETVEGELARQEEEIEAPLLLLGPEGGKRSMGARRSSSCPWCSVM